MFFFQNIQSSFSLIADNPTSESVTFSFGGIEYTLKPYSQQKIDIKPLKTYLYKVGDEEISIKNTLSKSAHFLNPTKSQYFQISDIYCLPGYTSCDLKTEKEVDIFTAYMHYTDVYASYIPEIPENAPICPEEIDNPEIVSDEEYDQIMEAG